MRELLIHSLGGEYTHWTILATYMPAVHSNSDYPCDMWGSKRRTHNLMSGVRISTREKCENLVKEWNRGNNLTKYVAIPATNYCA